MEEKEKKWGLNASSTNPNTFFLYNDRYTYKNFFLILSK